MALDIGEKRVGVAVSDPDEVLANGRSFRIVLADWEPELFLCGLPMTLSGEEGPQAERVRGFAEAVAKRIGIPLEFADERLSSAEAKRSLREKGLSEKAMRGKVDMIAASIFLQSWLDARNGAREQVKDG